MNPHHRDRQELLEDIFAPERDASITAGDVVEIIARAKAARRNGRRLAACAVSLVAAAGVCAALLHSNPAREPQRAAKASPPAAPAEALAGAMAPIVPPGVERVDDEAMLAMIEDQPAALVRWPDGRQTLLVMNAADGNRYARALRPPRRFGSDKGR